MIYMFYTPWWCSGKKKNPPANTGDTGDADLISGSRRSPGEGNGNPFHYSCLENPLDRGEPGGLQSLGWQRVRHD